MQARYLHYPIYCSFFSTSTAMGKQLVYASGAVLPLLPLRNVEDCWAFLPLSDMNDDDAQHSAPGSPEWPLSDMNNDDFQHGVSIPSPQPLSVAGQYAADWPLSADAPEQSPDSDCQTFRLCTVHHGLDSNKDMANLDFELRISKLKLRLLRMDLTLLHTKAVSLVERSNDTAHLALKDRIHSRLHGTTELLLQAHILHLTHTSGNWQDSLTCDAYKHISTLDERLGRITKRLRRDGGGRRASHHQSNAVGAYPLAFPAPST